jgi:hypothetical protein
VAEAVGGIAEGAEPEPELLGRGWEGGAQARPGALCPRGPQVVGVPEGLLLLGYLKGHGRSAP